MTKESLIEKIKSLLALATGVGNEHEKRLALSRAQELMARYAVDLSEKNHVEDIIKSEYIPKFEVPLHLRNKMELMRIITPIAENFGCYLALANEIRVFGFSTNIEVTKFAIDTLLYQGIQDFKREYRIQRSTAFAPSFWSGFRKGLEEKFEKPSEKALVLYDKVKNVWENSTRSVDVFFANSNASGAEIGFNSAKNAVLNPGIQSSSRGNLLK